MIKIFDTFAGVWGFHLALKNAIWKNNVQAVWFSEIDKFAIQTYLKNFPGAKDFWDITKIDIQNLPDFDLLTGGFPCQDVSVAGKQNLNWGRTVLVEYLLQILENKKPKYFIFENVKGLMSEKFETFRESVMKRIIDAGYNFNLSLLNTKDFLTPQNRERIFFVWIREDFEFTYKPPEKQKLEIFLKDILESWFTDRETSYCLDANYFKCGWLKNYFYDKKRQLVFEGLIHIWEADIKGNECIKRVYDINGICPALTTMGGWHREPKIAINEKTWRKLTPLECERLQGFPDNWTAGISNSQRYKQMGNAISVPVVESIFKNLFNNL